MLQGEEVYLRKSTVLLAAAAFVGLLASCETTDSAAPDPYVEALRPFVDRSEFSGVALVTAPDGVLFRGRFGEADRELGVPFADDIRFRFHSLTKPLLSAAVLSTVADGGLAIDGSICDYLAFCPESWTPVTIRHLLAHRSGIPDFSKLLLDGWAGSLQTTFTAIRADLDDLTTVSPPGRDFQYSNSGYVLLAHVLERVDGRPIAQVMRRRVFDPAGMAGAGMEESPPWDEASYDGPVTIPRMATGYNGTPQWQQVAYSKMYTIPGAGAAYGTADDLDSFARAMFRDGLLPPELRQAAVQVDGARVPYALGWVVRERHGQRVYRHDGGNNGFMTSLEYYPDRGLTVIVLSNLGFTPIEEIRDRLGELALR